MRNILSIIAIVVTCGIAWAAEPSAPKEQKGMPLVFSDDFEHGSDRWEFTDAKAWKVDTEDANHVLSLFGASKYEPKFRSPLNIAWIKDINVSDFVIEARLKQTGKEYGHRDLCLFFGHKDATHFYYVHLATKADEHANSIFLVNNAPRVSIAQERTDGTKWGPDYHRVRIERDSQAGTILVYFDDMAKPVMKATDKTFVSGGIGVGSFDDVGNFDDVHLWGKAAKTDSEKK